MKQEITFGMMVRALLAARVRTGDKDLSHVVKAGRFMVVRCVMTKSSSVVTPLSDWNTGEAHLSALNAL